MLAILRLQYPDEIGHAGPIAAIREARDRVGFIGALALPDPLQQDGDQPHGVYSWATLREKLATCLNR
jgi:hypothetical protein